MAVKRAKTVQRGYGASHKRLREAWAHLVSAGGVVCARCGRPIAPGSAWDLGHHDKDRNIYTGPEHARCNRGAPSRRRRRAEPAPVVPVDDPERGIFWGPPGMSGHPLGAAMGRLAQPKLARIR